ncbi:GNS1/SUR4 family protein [Pseudomassariella vexata]|uniref:Elongation of fatty acids protein n=1 Tax=Pseudomassariella vexata TaxID=1141098 RepID=A0A1Y2DA14_9PEZI|nr:GNS1/SUR4 family protein [Pseudomassariella vexata]ORY55505.1 GNS1/SUR4 family protein [Pseudomassariella vexata]
MSFDNRLSFPPNATHVVKPHVLTPWGVFNALWTFVMGYRADEFEFVQGKTPFSTFAETAGMIVLYVIVIFGGRELMRNRQPLKLNGLFKIHNLFLTLLSGGLLVLFIDQLVPQIWKHGLYENICGSNGWTRPLETLYYLNYITKYIELIDTVFLMVKKKPLTFLHTYHHPATALLCYTQLVGHTPVSWVPITLNLAVHVVMYWYYFQSACGVKVGWKQWITRLQITQFVLDLGFVYFACWDYWAGTYHPWLPHLGRCRGEPVAAATGCLILTSYLVLFVMFYISTYKKKKPGPCKDALTGPKKSGKNVAVAFTTESCAKLATDSGCGKQRLSMMEQ